MNMNLEFIDKVGGQMKITLKIEVAFTRIDYIPSPGCHVFWELSRESVAALNPTKTKQFQ